MASKEIILCDTNIIIEFFKNNINIVQELKNIGEDATYISSITTAELYFGALNKLELNKIKKRLDKVVQIPINESISNIFENLMYKYSLSHKLSIPDAIIAATALNYDLELFTLNLKDFQFIENLRLYKLT